jgi:L-lactate dehydrogenase
MTTSGHTTEVGHRSAHRVASVAIVGPGLVGTTTAYGLLISGTAAEIVLIGRDRKRVDAQVQDLRDATLYSHPTRIVSGDFSDCTAADVIIITAGASQRFGMTSRLHDLKESGAILKEIIQEIARQAPRGVLLIASNPVDVLTYAAWKWSGMPSNRVIGSGTSLDTSRFRRRLADRYGVAAENIHAYVIGEHGDSQVALLSSARIAGTPLQEFCGEQRVAYDDTALRTIANDARAGGRQIVLGKGSTQYGISAALTRIVGAILRDEHAVLTVSSLAPEQMNVGKVYLSLPAIITRNGIDRVVPIGVNDEESRALQESAGILRQHLQTLGLPD